MLNIKSQQAKNYKLEKIISLCKTKNNKKIIQIHNEHLSPYFKKVKETFTHKIQSEEIMNKTKYKKINKYIKIWEAADKE